MKFFHISDLHIGKQLNGYSLQKVQEAAFGQILACAARERPDAFLICGDIYDKSVPSAESFAVFDRFLTELSQQNPGMEILIISGNHDSPERLSYGSAFLERHHIHIAAAAPSEETQHLQQVTLCDEWGPVHFYLFPFIRPGHVRRLLGETGPLSYTEAFGGVLARERIEESERNVLLAHQFFVREGQAPATSDSETAVLLAGGLDQIDASLLELFDYAALGHLHGPQRAGKEQWRYCGSPCQYSLSEERQQKSVAMVTLREKGSAPEIALLPLRTDPPVRRYSGSFEEICAAARERIRETGGGRVPDFAGITLTDPEEPPDLREQLEGLFERILEIRLDRRSLETAYEQEEEGTETLSALDAFAQFYEMVRQSPLSGKQRRIMERVIREAEEGERS